MPFMVFPCVAESLLEIPRPLRWPLLNWVVTFFILSNMCLSTGPALASERSEIFRHSRSSAVLLVSVDKVTNSLAFGTGFFISDEGHILTNAHVLPDPSTLLVYIPEQGVFLNATRVIVDQDADLAVLHLSSVRGRALPLSSVSAEEGTEALAAGYPRVIDTLQMGLTLHATVKPVNISGWAMGRSRTQGRIIPFIQSSGVIHSGTSGGPLVDAANGQVLGMVVHSVPYVGQATDRQGSMIGSVLLRADMSYAIPATRIRQWLVDHQVPHASPDSLAESSVSSGPRSLMSTADPHRLGMSLFLTGHLVQTIADTVKSGQDFLELAVQHYQKALELLPGKSVIARNLALSYRTLHRYQEALTIYEAMLQASPSDLPVMNEAAQTSTFLGDEQKAMRLYRTVLERDSCSLDGLNGIGYLYLQHLEYTKAIQTFQQAVKCVPSSAYAAYYLGESMARSGLVEEARDSWEQSLNRVTIRTVQEKEFFHRMQERILGIPALLSHASPISMAGNPQIQ